MRWRLQLVQWPPFVPVTGVVNAECLGVSAVRSTAGQGLGVPAWKDTASLLQGLIAGPHLVVLVAPPGSVLRDYHRPLLWCSRGMWSWA